MNKSEIIKAQTAALDALIKAHPGMTRSSLARECGITPTTLTRLGRHSYALSSVTIARIKQKYPEFEAEADPATENDKTRQALGAALARLLNIPLDDVELILEAYIRVFPTLREWPNLAQDQAQIDVLLRPLIGVLRERPNRPKSDR